MSPSTKPCLSQAGSAAKRLKGEHPGSAPCGLVPLPPWRTAAAQPLSPCYWDLCVLLRGFTAILARPCSGGSLPWELLTQAQSPWASVVALAQGRGRTQQAAPESHRPRPAVQVKAFKAKCGNSETREPSLGFTGTAHRMAITTWTMQTSHPQFSKWWLPIWLRNGLGARAPQKVSCGLLQALPQKDNRIHILNLQNISYS